MAGRLAVMLALIGLLSCSAAMVAADEPKSAAHSPELQRRLQKLIAQLGSDQYATREKAQGELEQIGLAAFDMLHAAQDHDDVEIALRARYLLRAMPIPWTNEQDPAEVRTILRGYSDQSESERSGRIDQLGTLDAGRGIPALCRVARFETSHLLAKQAAIRVMRYEPEADAEKRTLIELINVTMGSSQRSAAEWLRVYGRTLIDPIGTLAAWQKLITAEQVLQPQSADRSSPAIVRDLFRWQIDHLLKLDRRNEAVAIADKIAAMDIQGEKETEETVEWLIDRKFYAQVEQLAGRYVDKNDGPAMLLYLLAETQRAMGKDAESEQTSKAGFDRSGNQAESRNPIAERLRDRGQFDWAEREFREVLKLRELGHPFNMYSRFILSEMLHDIQKDRDAAEVLQPLVEELDRNPMLVEFLQRLFRERDTASIKSRMHYFRAQDALSRNDFAAHKKSLDEAVACDARDVDVLIAMYRLPMADQAWVQQTRGLIDAAASEFLGKISTSEMRFPRVGESREREEELHEWAKQCNQYAWLVGNTEGDIDLAIRFSWKSIELRPKASGYYDTLARCYYRKGDLDAAVKHQSYAVKMEPHSGQMRRQLKLFEDARAAKRAKS